MNFLKIEKLYYLLILLAGILAVYIYFFSFLDINYSPYYGDEYFYFKNSESFYLTNSLKAVFTYSGSGAKIFGADAHGPAYPLIYGSIAKLIGWGGLTIPIINLGILMLAILAMIWKNGGSKDTKLLQVILVLGSPITLFYSVTYLAELLQIAGAIGLFILMQRYLRKEKLHDFIYLIFFIFLLGTIRSTWFFAFFGLVVVPGPIKGNWKSIYVLVGLALPFAFQHFFHEQVPNTFSDLGKITESRQYLVAFNSIIENLRQNISYIFTYSDGDFYAMQKVWFYTSLIISITIFRKDRLILIGLVILGSIVIFNLFIYKNYSWVDLRMYTPMIIFLNLGIIENSVKKYPIVILLTINLFSFVLILPLQKVIMNYRVPPRMVKIPLKTISEVSKLDTSLIYIDTTLLSNYKIIDLPNLNTNNKPIIYILPYYIMDTKKPSHYLVEVIDHSCVKLIKILNQNITPKVVCNE